MSHLTIMDMARGGAERRSAALLQHLARRDKEHRRAALQKQCGAKHPSYGLK